MLRTSALPHHTTHPNRSVLLLTLPPLQSMCMRNCGSKIVLSRGWHSSWAGTGRRQQGGARGAALEGLPQMLNPSCKCLTRQEEEAADRRGAGQDLLVQSLGLTICKNRHLIRQRGRLSISCPLCSLHRSTQGGRVALHRLLCPVSGPWSCRGNESYC